MKDSKGCIDFVAGCWGQNPGDLTQKDETWLPVIQRNFEEICQVLSSTVYHECESAITNGNMMVTNESLFDNR